MASALTRWPRTCSSRAWQPSPLEHAELAASLLHHADLHAKLLLPSIVSAACFPALLGLACGLLSTCREPDTALSALELCAALATKSRTLG